MINISLKPFTGKAKQSGKEFHCYQLCVGDYGTLIFPRGDLERSYLSNVIGDGLDFEVENED